MANRFKAINVSLGSSKNKPVDAEVTSMQGRKGDPGPYFTPSVDENGNISWENNGGLINPTTRNIKGPKGDNGNDGAPGATGPQGPQGQAGVSPSISVTDITGGHRVTITDATGDHVFDVMDGEGSVLSVNGKTGAVKLYYEVTTREQLILASYDAGVNVPFLFKASGQLVTDLGGQTNYSALGLGMVNGQYTGQLFFILLQAGSTRFRYGYINVTLGTVTFSGQVANTGDIPSFPSSGVPADLGTASQGSANTVARSDHVHPMPSASDVGAVSLSDLLNLVYPVGSIYMSVNSIDPGTIIGGTWERITGRFLLGTDTTENDPGTYPAGSTGGSERVTLTANQSGQRALTITGGAHAHNIKYRNDQKTATSGDSRRFGPYADSSSGSQYSGASTSSNSHSHSVTAQDATESHNNMPPYLAVYVWKRTA